MPQGLDSGRVVRVPETISKKWGLALFKVLGVLEQENHWHLRTDLRIVKHRAKTSHPNPFVNWNKLWSAMVKAY